MEKIILGAGVLNLFLGVLALRQGERTKEIVSFGVFCVVTGLWCLSNFLLYLFFDVLFLKLAYAFGALTVASLLSWSFFYNERLKRYWIHTVIYLVGIGVAVFSMLDHYIVGEVRGLTASGIDADEGRFFSVFSAYLLLTIIWSIVNVFLIYRRAEGAKKHQARYVLIGISGFMLVTLLVSGILPSFGILGLTNLDSPSSLIFVIFAMLAIVRHKFLGAKVILTQILASVLVTISLIQLIGSRTFSETVTNVIALIVVFVVGESLVRNVLTEVKRKEEFQDMATRLARANEELRQLDTTKSEFVSIASHQLRTPLTAIKGYVALALEGSYGPVNESLKDILRKIGDVNTRLAKLVADLLSVSRIETGRIQYHYVPSRLETLVTELVEMFQMIAQSRKLGLDIHLPAKSLPQMMLDENKIKEVISNLIDNALKYTSKGSVSISVEEGEGCARVVVSDTGIGMKPEDRARLFEKFVRSSETSKIDVAGTGLGLFVSRNFVESHGGRIFAESDGPGQGSRFIVELPFKNPFAEKAEA